MLALRDLLKPERMTTIVDVVAGDAVEGNPPYQRMLDEGACIAVTIAPDVGVVVGLEAADLLKITGQCETAGKLAAWPDKIAVQIEASFFPRPTFGSIDSELRQLGLILHCFADCYLTTIATDVGIPHADPHQLARADLFYVRDFQKPMGNEQWKHLALIAHHVCGSHDLAMHAVTVLAKRAVIASDAPQQYQRMLESQ